MRRPDLATRHAALWQGLTVVSLDVETCTADDGDHVIALGAVKVFEDKVVDTLTRLVNPGVPVNHTQIHGLTDADVAGAQDFAALEPVLTALLTAGPGQLLVLAAHNAPFDLSRLRLEYSRLGRDLPDVAVLDTMKLAPLLGVVPQPQPSLRSMLAALRLVNANPHEALADATAVSDAVRAMLRLAAKAGRTSFSELLAELPTRARTARDVAPAARARGAERRSGALSLPAAHTAGHAVTLPAAPTEEELAAWSAHAEECVELLCPELASKAIVAAPHAAALLKPAEKLLRSKVKAGVSAQANTALLLVSLLGLAAPATGQQLLAQYDRIEKACAVLPSCPASAREVCPGCRENEGCIRDTWHHAYARKSLSVGADDLVPREARRVFSPPSGSGGRVETWLKMGRPRLAGHAMWLVAESWAIEGAPARRVEQASHAWAYGLREPRLVVHHARKMKALLSSPADPQAGLLAAIDVCESALLVRSTEPAWLEVVAERDRLSAQLLVKPPRQRSTADDQRQVRPLGRETRLRFKPRQ